MTPDGEREVMARVAPQTLPFSSDWLPDGRLLVIDGSQRLLLRHEPDGTFNTVADLTGFGSAPFNEVVVDELVGFDIAEDGTLSARRVWAGLEHAPGGICADADGAVWVAGVPGQYCVRVREGGQVLDTVAVDRGCLARMLGGAHGRTLFIAAAEWRGMKVAMTEGPGSDRTAARRAEQPAPHAGRP